MYGVLSIYFFIVDHGLMYDYTLAMSFVRIDKNKYLYEKTTIKTLTWSFPSRPFG